MLKRTLVIKVNDYMYMKAFKPKNHLQSFHLVSGPIEQSTMKKSNSGNRHQK